MQPLSKEARDRILTGLERLDLTVVSPDGDPNTALAKAAKDHGIPAGHVPIMVRAYNTARVNQQRLEGKTPHQKAASCPLADPAVVLEMIYPEKRAAERFDRHAVSAEYDTQPKFALAKQAEARAVGTVWEKTAAAPAPRPQQVEDPWVALHRDGRRLDAVRTELLGALADIDAGLQKLAHHFQTSGQDFLNVREHVRGRFGALGSYVLDQVRYRLPHPVVKSAKARPVRYDGNAEPFRTLETLVPLVKEAAEAQQGFQELERELAAKHVAAIHKVAYLKPSDSILPKQAAMAPTAQGAVLGYLARTLGNHGDTNKREDLIQQQFERLVNPAATRSYLAHETTATINDLIAEDPQIAQYDPLDIVEAYNQIQKAGPDVARQPLLLRGLMRRYLEQGYLDPFDVEQTVIKPQTDISRYRQDSGIGKMPDFFRRPAAVEATEPKPNIGDMADSMIGRSVRGLLPTKATKPMKPPKRSRDEDA